MKEQWITDLKIGDIVYTIERHKDIPGGEWKWKSVVTKIESNYIETEFERERLDWLEELTKKLAVHHRTYQKQFVKNYFYNNEINITQYK